MMDNIEILVPAMFLGHKPRLDLILTHADYCCLASPSQLLLNWFYSLSHARSVFIFSSKGSHYLLKVPFLLHSNPDNITFSGLAENTKTFTPAFPLP